MTVQVDPKIFGRVGVLMGGWSSERKISLKSGNGVMSALNHWGIEAVAIDATPALIDQLRDAHIDRAFIALHGEDGETGYVQTILEAMSIPYTGSGRMACAFTIDKHRCKWLWRGAGLLTPDFVLLHSKDDLPTAEIEIGFPMVIKPSSAGSSLGVSIVKEPKDLLSAFNHAQHYDSTVLAEKFISGNEYTVGIVGDRVLPPIHIQPSREFFDYEAKYDLVDTTEFICPADLSSQLEEKLKKLALRAYEVCGCSGWGRVDFMADKEGNFYLIELNPSPGMTSGSLVPTAARTLGIDYNNLVLNILRQTLPMK